MLANIHKEAGLMRSYTRNLRFTALLLKPRKIQNDFVGKIFK